MTKIVIPAAAAAFTDDDRQFLDDWADGADDLDDAAVFARYEPDGADEADADGAAFSSDDTDDCDDGDLREQQLIDAAADRLVDGADGDLAEILVFIACAGGISGAAQLRSLVATLLRSPEPSAAMPAERLARFAIKVADIKYALKPADVVVLAEALRAQQAAPPQPCGAACGAPRHDHGGDARFRERLYDDHDGVEAYDDDELMDGIARLAMEAWSLEPSIEDLVNAAVEDDEGDENDAAAANAAAPDRCPQDDEAARRRASDADELAQLPLPPIVATVPPEPETPTDHLDDLEHDLSQIRLREVGGFARRGAAATDEGAA
ncbi:hypothetical protein M885DRAFT_528384 [Pelagophyceae sp. CCMP2097]|nr:hypothetical protein M885DRAFT_528384 [Pelagophyceae sp. CCMP2097]